MLRLLVPAWAGLVLLALAGPAAAGGSKAYTDPAGDARGAPDIVGVAVANDDDGRVSFQVALAAGAGLPEGQAVELLLDTDMTLQTGNRDGADYSIVVEHDAEGVYAAVAAWKNGAWTWETPQQTISLDGLTVTIDRSELGSTPEFSFWAFTWVRDGADEQYDVAPDRGDWLYELNVVKRVHRSVATFSAKAPVAAKRFAITGVKLTAADGESISTSSYACTATLGGKVVPLAGRCAWKVPKGSKGKILHVTVQARHAGGRVTLRPYVWRIR